MLDTMPPNPADSSVPPSGTEPVLRREARAVRADRSLAAMVLVICTLGGMGVGFGFAMYLMRAQLAYMPSSCFSGSPIVAAAQNDSITWLGVGIRSLSDHSGSQVVRVYSDTAAEAAGLRPGDVVTRIDGDDVHDADDLVSAVRTRAPGDIVPISIQRNGQPLLLRARLGSR